MRKLTTTTICAILMLAASAAAAPKSLDMDVHIYRATPRVRGVGDGWGTLVGILEDGRARRGYIILPHHIAAQSVHVIWYNGERSNYSRVVKWNRSSDLAMALVTVPAAVEPVKLSTKYLKPNDQVFVADLRDNKFRLPRGNVRGYTSMSGSKLMKDRSRRVPADPDDPISGDNTLVVNLKRHGEQGEPRVARDSISGSGIYTGDGKLAGMTWGFDNRNLYGVDIGEIHTKLDDWDMLLACNMPATQTVGTRFRFRPVPRTVPRSNPVVPPRTNPPVAPPMPQQPGTQPIPSPHTDPTMPIPSTPGGGGDHVEINAKLDEILAGIVQLTDRIEILEQRGPMIQLTEIQEKLVNISKALTLTPGNGQDNGRQTIQLVVTSPPRVDPDYVDVSTLWAIQRETGISHAVLVVNSEDPAWESTMKPEFERARLKFPTLQLVDVKSQNIKISPTPQLVIYYVEESGVAPEVISTTQGVYDRLKIFYSN